MFEGEARLDQQLQRLFHDIPRKEIVEHIKYSERALTALRWVTSCLKSYVEMRDDVEQSKEW